MGMEIMEKEKNKKRGRKPKNEKKEYVLNRDQTKFFIDYGDNKKELGVVFDLLVKANKKGLGRDIVFKDLAMFGLSKLNEKDLEKIQESSLTEMERVYRSLEDYNEKSGLRLCLGEYLSKKLGV
jgi:hypothetical protein